MKLFFFCFLLAGQFVAHGQYYFPEGKNLDDADISTLKLESAKGSSDSAYELACHYANTSGINASNTAIWLDVARELGSKQAGETLLSLNIDQVVNSRYQLSREVLQARLLSVAKEDKDWAYTYGKLLFQGKFGESGEALAKSVFQKSLNMGRAASAYHLLGYQVRAGVNPENASETCYLLGICMRSIPKKSVFYDTLLDIEPMILKQLSASQKTEAERRALEWIETHPDQVR